MSRTQALLATLLFTAGLLVAGLPSGAAAQSRGGRIYNPKRLRPRPEAVSRGRIIKDPRKAPNSPRQPARRRALIPNPEKVSRGGSKYTKRGKYYYEKPSQIRAGGNTRRRVERVKIPHPNRKQR